MDVHTPFFVSRRYRSDNSWLDMVRANWRFWSASAQAATGNVADVKASMSGRDHERIVNAYDDTVSYVDECLAKLRNDLSQTDPTIVVHADHGEALGEHGTYGHHATLYEENLHVPFVVWNAGSDETVTTPTSLKRVPEILAIVRQNSMELSAEYFESISEFVVAESKQGGQITARWGDWKLMKGPDGESLYRLDESPDEKTDVLETYPDVADVLRHGINRRETQNSETQTVIKGAEKIGLEQS